MLTNANDAIPGTQVRTRHEIAWYPNPTIPAGTLGVVVHADKDTLWIVFENGQELDWSYDNRDQAAQDLEVIS